MKQLKASSLALAAVVFLSCGVEQSEQPGSPAATEPDSTGSTSQALCSCGAIPQQPVIPNAPTQWKGLGSQTLFPATANSAYVVYYEKQGDPNSFYAWGFDVSSPKCLFFLEASKREYPAFVENVAKDIVLIPQKNPAYKGEGSTGQLNQPHGPGPMGVPSDVWVAGYQAYATLH